LVDGLRGTTAADGRAAEVDTGNVETRQVRERDSAKQTRYHPSVEFVTASWLCGQAAKAETRKETNLRIVAARRKTTPGMQNLRLILVESG
jgi:hypothetical protein